MRPTTRFGSGVATAIGLDDAWPVRAEPYSQWVVERNWATAMPPLSEVGVQVVDDVVPWEVFKLRVSTRCTRPRRTTDCSTGSTPSTWSPPIRAAERSSTVSRRDRRGAHCPRDVDVHTYVETTLRRFGNPGLGHRCDQIATDTSQKLLHSVAWDGSRATARGLPIDALADVLALWTWSTLGLDHTGPPRVVVDRGVRLRHGSWPPAHSTIASTQGGLPRPCSASRSLR